MCNQPLRTDAERLIMGPVADLIGTSPFRIAPERQQRLADEVLGGDPLDLEWVPRVGDHVKFWFDDRKITAAYAAALGLWAVTCATILLMDEVKPAQTAAWLQHGEEPPRDARIELDRSPGTPIHQSFGMIKIAERLLRDPATPWGAGLPTPEAAAPENSFERRAMNLFLAAIGWVFLHEIGHFTCGHAARIGNDLPWEEQRPERARELEFEADEWATEWTLEGASDPQQKEFRILAIAVAMVWLGIVHSVRRESPTHPPAWERLARIQGIFGTGEESPALWLAGCMMKTFFAPDDDAPVRDDALDLFVHELIRTSRVAR
jgi:hypothetical protein